MIEISDKKRWEALARGQVLSATVSKFMTVIQLLDQKAQVMIFLNSILIPVCIKALENGTFHHSAIISIVTSVLSILAAIICIYPKRRYRKSCERGLNLLHFNDIGHLKEQEYMDMFNPIFNDPNKLAEIAVRDIYDTSRYSILPKFVWLKISYFIFAIGNIIAITAVLLEV